MRAGGVLQATYTVGNGIAAFCTSNPPVCTRAEFVMNIIDKYEEAGLAIQGIIQTARGDTEGAAQTAIQWQAEQLDGGLPGNTVAAEIGEEIVKYGDNVEEIIRLYGDDAVEFIGLYGDDAVHLIGEYGYEGIALLRTYGPESLVYVNRLTPLLGDESFGVALKQGPDAVEALTHWSDDMLLKYGDELALRAGNDAKALKASVELAKLNNTTSPEARELIDIIAKNSAQGNGDRLVLGKWVNDGTLDSGFIGVARADGSQYFFANPGMSKAFKDLNPAEKDELYWAINEQVLSNMVASVDKIDYSFNGLNPAKIEDEIAAIDAIVNGKSEADVISILDAKNFPFRMREVKFLLSKGYTYEIDEVKNMIHWVKPFSNEAMR